jgi:hypothetical protein
MAESTAYGEVNKRYELIIKQSIFLQQFPFTHIPNALTSKLQLQLQIQEVCY